MKKHNTLELALSASMPFMALILIALSNFVTFGFKPPDSNFWIKAVINTVALLCFFLPFKAVFKEKYLQSERIKNKQSEYSNLVSVIFDNKITAFNLWTEIEYQQRKNKYINNMLQLAYVDFECFKSYEMSMTTVLKNKTLKWSQKKVILKIIWKIPRIKRIDVDRCLPGTDSNTIFDRLSTSEEREDKKLTCLKVLRSLMICAGFAMLGYTTDFSNFATEYIAILTELGLKLLIGLWHIFGASRVANRIINKVYFKELSEKSLVIEEFLESINK